MKKVLCLLLFLSFCLLSHAQITFETGYFINNNGDTINGLIKNVDWKNNPIEFEYKSSETSEIQNKSLQGVKEFAILGAAKFVRYAVKINTSSDDARLLDGDRNVEFEDKTLFLKELVAGDANLYYYESGNLRRFFYNVGTIDTEQLIYKRYYYSPTKVAAEQQLNKSTKISSTSIGNNNTFRQQVWNTMKCKDISRNALDKLSYKKDALVKLFEKYNQCANPEWTGIKRDENKLNFNISVRPGVNLSSLNISNDRGVTSFESKMNLRIGVEFEFVLPFNKNKWALLIEPTYRNYQGIATRNISFAPDPQELDVDYASIEFAAGVRYYAFLNSNSKIFLSGYMLNDMELDASASNPTFVSSRLQINPLSNFAVGIGYKLKDKFSLEFRYDFDRGIIRTIPFASEFKNMSLILGYTIL